MCEWMEKETHYLMNGNDSAHHSLTVKSSRGKESNMYDENHIIEIVCVRARGRMIKSKSLWI